MSRPPLPPFTEATAKQKVQAAEDGWNSRDPAKVAQAYTENGQWRTGYSRAAVETPRAFLQK